MFDWFFPRLRCRHKWKRTGREWGRYSIITNYLIGHKTEQECEKCGRIRYTELKF